MNDFTPSGVKQRRAIIISSIVAVLVFGFLIYKGWGTLVNNEIDRTVIITGQFTCLPPKSGEIEPEACVLGVESRDGKYYALDISRIQDANTDLQANDTIAVTGWLQPQSIIPNSVWRDFDIENIILVNTLLRTGRRAE